MQQEMEQSSEESSDVASDLSESCDLDEEEEEKSLSMKSTVSHGGVDPSFNKS